MVTREGAELWFQPYYYFLILLQSSVPVKAWAAAQSAKHVKAQLLRLKPGVGDGGTQASFTLQQGPLGWGVRVCVGGEGGGQSEEKTSRVAKTEALESDRPRICIPACATPCLCEFQGFPSRV